MNELALFTGAGLGLLGTHALLGWRTVCAVENESYCQAVLLARQTDGIFNPFPIWDDVRTFDGRPWRDLVDVVTAGFPCQPFSAAGKRRGEADERNLWPDTIRIIREVAPRYCLLENSPNLLCTSYWGTILDDLATSGYSVRWCVLSACRFGAPHTRERLFAVAYTHEVNGSPRLGIHVEHNPKGEVQRGNNKAMRQNWAVSADRAQRMPDGCSSRLDRLQALGNGQVPGVVAAAWRLLSGSGGEATTMEG